jgi:hypothetical protein
MHKGIRLWAAFAVLAAFIGAVINPTIGYSFFGLLVLLLLLYAIPATKGISRATLGLSVGRPVATTMKMLFVTLLAVILLLVAAGSQSIREARELEEAQQMKAEAERQRLIANANARVDTLMVAVKGRMDAGDVVGASTQLAEVLKVEGATNKGPAQRLNDSILLSNSAKAVHSKLVGLDDAEFDAFASAGKVPTVFNLGYPVLSNAAVALARPMVAEARIERAAIAKKRGEEAERRRKEELARADAERKDREQKAAAEAAANAANQKEIKDKLDAYLAVLQSDDFASKIVDRVSVERRGDMWTATITVTNLWHLRDKQLRLQDAQNLWKAWALLASRNDPDKARISIVDFNGNEVGGSRMLAGSLIWVQD